MTNNPDDEVPKSLRDVKLMFRGFSVGFLVAALLSAVLSHN
jgi:hypothetical protein